MLFMCWTVFVVLGSRDLDASSESCQYYLSQSSIRGAGNGIFSTSKLHESSIIELSVAIYVRYSHIYESDLEDYIFATTDDSYGMVLLGLASLLNHNPLNNAEYYSEGNYADDVPSQVRGLEAYTVCSLSASRAIEGGDEIFINYGEEWFENRSELGQPVISSEYFPSRRLCMSTVEVGDSTRFAAGRGVFARQSFRSGELVAVSPSLLLPWHVVQDSKDSSILVNYCLHESGHSLAILPLSHMAMINHYRSAFLIDSAVVDLDESSSNVEVRWFNWDVFQSCDTKRSDEDCLNDPQIHRNPLISMNQKRSESKTVVLGYYATKDVEVGEELLLDYGREWWQAYKQFLMEVQRVESNNRTTALFRKAVGFRRGFMT